MRAWSPRCTGPWATIGLHGDGKVTVRPAIIEAVKALDACLVSWDYETRLADTGAYNCRPKVSGKGWSIHSYAIAIDINWQLNPYGGSRHHIPTALAAAICRIRTNNGKQVWNWGGFWSGTRDWMHFEVVCSPADLATGINWGTVPGSRPPTAPPPPVIVPSWPTNNGEDKDMYYRIKESGAIFHVGGMFYRHLSGPQWDAEVYLNGAKFVEVTAPQFMNYVSKRGLKDSNKVILSS